MSRLFEDTDPRAEAVLIRLLREMPPWRKMYMVGQMNLAVRQLAITGLKQRHPDDPPELIFRRLADLTLGPELAEKVYGPLVEDNDAG
jgi:hypothetical protein